MRLFSVLSLFAFSLSLFFFAWTFGAFRRLQGVLRRLLPFLLALVCLAGSLLSGIFALGLRHYAQLDREELIAVIQCERAYQKGADYTLLYTPVVRHRGAKTEAFQMRGDQWAFGGAILRWKGWMQFLGVKTFYRPLWIQEIPGFSPPRSLGQGVDPIRFLLQRMGPLLPFAQSSYVSWVSSPVEYGIQFRIYVTPSGFSLKKVATYFREIS